MCSTAAHAFLKSIYMTGNKKDATYITKQMSVHINIVPLTIVVQVFINNASSMVAARRILPQGHPCIFKNVGFISLTYFFKTEVLKDRSRV